MPTLARQIAAGIVPVNYTPLNASVAGNLQGIDRQLLRSGADYIIRNKAELVATASSIVGDVITLQPAIYRIDAPIDLRDSVPGTTPTSRLFVNGTTLIGWGANSNSGILADAEEALLLGLDSKVIGCNLANNNPAGAIIAAFLIDPNRSMIVLDDALTLVSGQTGISLFFLSTGQTALVQQTTITGGAVALEMGGAPELITVTGNTMTGNGIGLLTEATGQLDILNNRFLNQSSAALRATDAPTARLQFNFVVGTTGNVFENEASGGTWIITDNTADGRPIASMFAGAVPWTPDPPQGAGGTTPNMVFMRNNIAIDDLGAVRLMQETAIQTTANVLP